jgi:ABC-2 type transport system permease protein
MWPAGNDAKSSGPVGSGTILPNPPAPTSVKSPSQPLVTLLIFRYIFGGAIGAGELGYVDFVIPGIITTMIIWQGMGAAVSITEDHTSGLHDRLRSLPIPRSSVLAGRAVADTAILLWSLAIMTIVSFLIGFRLNDWIENGLAAMALIIAFSFAFEWVFITAGLYASNAQAAQGIALILVPLTFVSSAYVPLSSMPSGLRDVAENQPVTYMIDAVRSLRAVRPPKPCSGTRPATSSFGR